MASAYTPDQISLFLSRIQLPSKYHPSQNPKHDLAFLTALYTHTISTIPYENLTIHYSKTHTITLDPQHLFQKIVLDGRGRGGYCMENSLLFNHMLRGLGFHAYTVGVRIRYRKDGVPHGNYIGWVHIVNIVTLPDSTRWMLDVSFGGDGATAPLPLLENHITPNMGTQEIRLARDFLPDQTLRDDPARQMWIYQYRNGADREWNSFYAFSDLVEFLPADFHVMNWFTGSAAESFQTFTTLVVKFLRRMGEDGEAEIYGKRMLVNGVVKENLGGRTKVVKECVSEAERVEALREWFGIELTEEEREGIRGYVTELKG